MTAFVAAAMVLLVVVLVWLLRPLLRGVDAAGDGMRQANLAVLRDQLGELERDRAERHHAGMGRHR